MAVLGTAQLLPLVVGLDDCLFVCQFAFHCVALVSCVVVVVCHCVYPFKAYCVCWLLFTCSASRGWCLLVQHQVAVVYLFRFKVFHHASATRFSMGRLSSLAFHAFQRALRASHFRVVASLVFSACSWLVIVLPFVVLLFLMSVLYQVDRQLSRPIVSLSGIIPD